MEGWHQHFSEVLNKESKFSDEVILHVLKQSPCYELDEPPTEEELENSYIVKDEEAKGW